MSNHRNRIFKVYPFHVEPENYWDYHKKSATAVTREDLDNSVQFTTIRSFNTNERNELEGYKEQLSLYSDQLKLGKVIWPHSKHLFAANFHDLIDEISHKGLFIFDIWEFWPGVNSDSFEWKTATEYRCAPEDYGYMKEKIGKRFLGLSIGELDGNYILGYAPKICPGSNRREKQYFEFHKHFEEIWNDLYNDTSVLSSINFSHYFAKEGSSIILGAETAQAFMNVNLWYSFIRGAGKQYGSNWFGAISIFNRFGWKDYQSEGQVDAWRWSEFGPDSGTSLSLIHRLLYTLYAYNSVVLGLENGMVYSEGDRKGTLTPIGDLQSGAVDFVKGMGYPGAMYTPVAVLLDFFNGWLPPRNLFSTGIYKVWGNMPYEAGDYQAHALFSLLYPGYEDSGFFRDERGFLTATPHGDMTDILFSDVRQEILNTYNLLIVAGKTKLDAELYHKLVSFVENGGHLIIAIDPIIDSYTEMEAGLPGFAAFFGIENVQRRSSYAEGETISCQGSDVSENAFELFVIEPVSTATIVAAVKKDNHPLLLKTATKAGQVSLVAASYGMDSGSIVQPVLNCNDTAEQTLPAPFGLLKTVKAYIERCVDNERILDVDNGRLQYIVNLCNDGSFQLFVVNNNSNTEGFNIITNSGHIAHIEELDIPSVSSDTRGYYPDGKRPEDMGVTGQGKYSIEPLSIKLYRITLAGQQIERKAEAIIEKNSGNNYCSLNYCSLRNISSIKEEILSRPTLRDNFAGIKVDASYFAGRDEAALIHEADYVRRQHVDIIVDFSSMINHFPELTLLDIKTCKYSDFSRYQKSIALINSVFEKASRFGCKKAIFKMHMNAPGLDASIATELLKKSIREICQSAKKHDIIIYLQNGTEDLLLGSTDEMIGFIQEVQLENLKFCYNTCHGIMIDKDAAIEVIRKNREKIGGLLLSSPVYDRYKQFYDAHNIIKHSAYEEEIIECILELKESTELDFVCMDAVYSNWNEIYLDNELVMDILRLH